jgi:hypothetical protein
MMFESISDMNLLACIVVPVLAQALVVSVILTIETWKNLGDLQ